MATIGLNSKKVFNEYMAQTILAFILILLTNFAFIIFAYHLLSYVSRKMNLRERKPISAFKVALIAGAFDLLLTYLYDLVIPNTITAFLVLILIEAVAFYLIVKKIYHTKWQYTLSLTFFLLLTLVVAQVAVTIGMVAFLSLYTSI